MKNFFSSIFFKIIIAILIMCVGAFTYTAISGGSMQTPVTNLVSTILMPFQSATSSISNFFEGIYERSFKYEEVFEENELLKKQIAEAESEIRDLNYLAKENESLKSLLNIYEDKDNFEFEITEIIGRNISNLNSVLTIDKGSNAGIEVYDAVITEAGLIGYVSRVSYNNAQVTTILDPSLQIGAIASDTREVGVCEGSLELFENNNLKLSYLDKNTDVKIGDTIETSGIGGLYPKGILIGTVSSVSIEPHGVSKYAIIDPAADISSLNQVFIVKNF